MTTTAVVIIVYALLLLLRRPPHVASHGFLSSPRSRNLVAYEDRVYYPQTSDDPEPEDCPACLNRGGGGLATCGTVLNGLRNYDHPRNAVGGPMRVNVQGTYDMGSVIDVEVVLSTNHRGHFVFKACPMTAEERIDADDGGDDDDGGGATQECFDDNPLLFVSDELYGANADPNHPERVYVAPENIPTRVDSDKDGYQGSMVFRYKLKLPDGLHGDLVLIQWYYVAANRACHHAGYDKYDWPDLWSMTSDGAGDEDGEWDVSPGGGWGGGLSGLAPCEEILPKDGNGAYGESEIRTMKFRMILSHSSRVKRREK